MDLRVYMKSGNNYYIDVSEYDYGYIEELLTDSIDYEDSLTIIAKGKSHYLKCKEIEYFELDIIEDKTVNKNKIGF